MKPIPGAPDGAPIPPFPGATPQRREPAAAVPQPAVVVPQPAVGWLVDMPGVVALMRRNDGTLLFLYDRVLGKNRTLCHVGVSKSEAVQFASRLAIGQPASVTAWSNSISFEKVGSAWTVTARVGRLKDQCAASGMSVDDFADEMVERLRTMEKSV